MKETIMQNNLRLAAREGWYYAGIQTSGLLSYRKGSNGARAIEHARQKFPFYSEFKLITGARKRYRSHGFELAVVGR